MTVRPMAYPACGPLKPKENCGPAGLVPRLSEPPVMSVRMTTVATSAEKMATADFTGDPRA